MGNTPSFKEKKTTEAAALLLQLRGGRMAYLKLIKLLYYADREAISRWRCPITFDCYFSMDHGPILSHTLNLIKEGEDSQGGQYWSTFISTPQNREVELLESCPPMHLSRAEIDLLKYVYELHGHKNRWELRDETHLLPEWKDPEGSRLPISLNDIMSALKISTEEQEQALFDLSSEAAIEAALA